MAFYSCMPMFWKCWSGKRTLVFCNAGLHFEVGIELILLPNLMHVGRKFEDNLMVFNISILYSYICDQILADLDKTLKSLAYSSSVLGQTSFLK
jgi:hypothetical protein